MPSAGRGGCSARARYLTQVEEQPAPEPPDPAGEAGPPTMAPRHGTGMPFVWLFLIFGSFSWMGRGPRAGVPVASVGFVMQNPIRWRGCGQWRNHRGAGGTQGLRQPPKSGGGSQTRPPGTALAAKLRPMESTCRASVYPLSSVSRRPGIINASSGWTACRLLLEGRVRTRVTWACSGVRGAAGDPLLQSSAPREKGSTREPASGLFLTRSRSNFLWRGASSARGGRRGACQIIAGVSLQKAAAPERN